MESNGEGEGLTFPIKRKRSMKKVVFYLLGLLLPMACDQDNEKPVEPGILRMDVTLDTPLQINGFQDGASIGCFLLGEDGDGYEGCPCNLNVPAFLGGTAWVLSKETAVISPGEVQAYYPYDKDASDRRAIPMETASQTDYLYSGKEAFSPIQSRVTLRMRHALSLVRFNVSDFPGEIKAVRLNDVCVSAVLDMEDGVFSGQVVKSKTYGVENGGTEGIKIMAFPHDNDSVRVSFQVGTKEYPFSAVGNWPQGKEITYTVSFDEKTETLVSVGYVTIQDWEVKDSYEVH